MKGFRKWCEALFLILTLCRHHVGSGPSNANCWDKLVFSMYFDMQLIFLIINWKSDRLIRLSKFMKGFEQTTVTFCSDLVWEFCSHRRPPRQFVNLKIDSCSGPKVSVTSCFLEIHKHSSVPVVLDATSRCSSSPTTLDGR